MPVPLHQGARGGAGRGLVAHHRSGGDPLGGALGVGLDDDRITKGLELLPTGGEHLPLRGVDAGRAEDLLAQALVEADGERGGIAAAVGDPEQLAERGHLRLAPPATQALGDVEDHVGGHVGERAGEIGGGLERHHHVPVALDGGGDGGDGARRVELGLGVVLGRIDALHVVGQAHPERGLLRLAGRGLSGDAAPLASVLDDGADDVVELVASLPGPDEDPRARLERGERVDLEEVHLEAAPGRAGGGRGDAELAPAEVLEIHGPRDAPGERLDLLDHGRRELGRPHRDVLRLHVLEVVVVHVVQAGELRIDDELHRIEHPAAAQPLDQVTGHVGAAQVPLHDQPGLEAAELPVDHLGQLVGVLAHAEEPGDSLGGSLEVGLDDHRKGDVVERAALDGGAGDQAGARRGDAVGREDALGEDLVERDAEGVGARSGEGDPQLLEERGIEGLTHPALVALGGVEDEVGRQRLQPGDDPRGGPAHLDALHLVPGPVERAGDGVDRLGAVELGLLR